MDLLVNDLSVHEQFNSAQSFRDAFATLMAMRKVARRFGRDISCHRQFLSAKAVPNMTMQQVLQAFPRDTRRLAMRWLTGSDGRFWDEGRHHSSDDWLESDGKIVTDNAVGEAAYRQLCGIACGLVSIAPSDWNYTPVSVTWRHGEDGREKQHTAVKNWWDCAALKDELENAPEQMDDSWDSLRTISKIRFERLTFAEHCFKKLDSFPFARASAKRFYVLFGILDRLAHAMDDDGKFTEEGHRIYRDYFRGDRAWFSDSSESEKDRFREDLTFDHPANPGQSLFCPWHGKVSHGTLRLHFHWPIRAGEPVYIVYAGPKLTKS